MSDVTRPEVSTMADADRLMEKARQTLADPNLDPHIRTRLDAALENLRRSAELINELTEAARWLSDNAWLGDPRPCRYWFERGQRYCGRPEKDLPSHGESFAAHYYAPERRSGQDRRA